MGYHLKNLPYINFVISSNKERKEQERKKDVKIERKVRKKKGDLLLKTVDN